MFTQDIILTGGFVAVKWRKKVVILQVLIAKNNNVFCYPNPQHKNTECEVKYKDILNFFPKLSLALNWAKDYNKIQRYFGGVLALTFEEETIETDRYMRLKEPGDIQLHLAGISPKGL